MRNSCYFITSSYMIKGDSCGHFLMNMKIRRYFTNLNVPLKMDLDDIFVPFCFAEISKYLDYLDWAKDKIMPHKMICQVICRWFFFISHSVYRNEANHKKTCVNRLYIHIYIYTVYIYIYTRVYVYTCSFTSGILQCTCFLEFKMFRPTSAGHLLKLQPLLGCCPFLFGSHVFKEIYGLKQQKKTYL